MEERTVLPVRKCSQLTAMSLDDSSANREPQARSLQLGRDERIKHLIYLLWINSRAGILHCHDNPSPIVTLRY